MTEVGRVYGEALYALAREEGMSQTILGQLKTLERCFSREPDFLRVLAAPNLPKAERCRILDACFLGKVEPYVLNFLKILTERGYLRHFSRCVAIYQDRYYRDNGILRVTVVTAVVMDSGQMARLSDKLHRITGRRIELENRVDPRILGGVRLDYDGKRLDDSVSYRLDAIRGLLKNAVL